MPGAMENISTNHRRHQGITTFSPLTFLLNRDPPERVILTQRNTECA